jgi:holo-[acyl-carrier protein] synthase
VDGHAQLVRIGHDLQRVEDLRDRVALTSSDCFFTQAELAHAAKARDSVKTLAGLFCAKEALFKSLEGKAFCLWSDMEVAHTAVGSPVFHLGGALAEHFSSKQLATSLSISHSGDYASAVVAIFHVERPQTSEG